MAGFKTKIYQKAMRDRPPGGNGRDTAAAEIPDAACRELRVDEFDLSEKERMFAEEYLVHFDATRATIAAGYAEKKEIARTRANELRKRPQISKFIEQRKQQRLDELGISQERLLMEYARVAYATPADYYKYDEEEGWRAKQLDELTEDQKAAISDIVLVDKKVVKFTRDGEKASWKKSISRVILQDKMKAMEALAKYQGLFKEGAAAGASGVGATVEDILKEFPEELAYLVRKQMFKELVHCDYRQMPDAKSKQH